VFDGWFGAFRAAVEEGLVGRVLEFKVRYGYCRGPVGRDAPVAEGGPPLSDEELAGLWWNQKECGGGAIMDFAGFGAMYALHFIGTRPESVLALAENLNTPWADVPDHAVLLVRFPGAVAALESVWNGGAGGYPSGPFLSGTDGTLMFESIEGNGRGVVLRRPDGTKEALADIPPPAGRTDMAGEFIHHLDTGEPLHPVLDVPFNLDVMAVLDAATRSAAGGRIESVTCREM
jgi:glucose-fructose oxidoreductase